MSHVGIKCRSQDMSKFVDCSCRRQILSLGYHVIQQTTSSFSYVANTLPTGYTHRNTWYMQVCLRGMCCPASPCQRFGHSYSILTTYLSQLAWTGNKVSMLWQAESLSFCRSWKRESLAETFKNQGVPERYVINSIQILRLISFLFLSFFFFFSIIFKELTSCFHLIKQDEKNIASFILEWVCAKRVLTAAE